MDTSPLEFTKDLKLNLHRCAIEKSKSGFRIDNPLLKTCEMRISKCSFEDCLKIFNIRGWNHNIEVSLSRFRNNDRCFQVFPKDTLEMNELTRRADPVNEIQILNNLNQLEAINKIKSFKPNVGSDSLKIVKCAFQYNKRILMAEGYRNGIQFTQNRVINTVEGAIEIESCAQLDIRNCVFEENYDDTLFAFESETSFKDRLLERIGKGENLSKKEFELYQAKKRKIRKERVEAKIANPSLVLIKSVQSNLRVRKNQFLRNDGALIELGSLDNPDAENILDDLSVKMNDPPPNTAVKGSHSNVTVPSGFMNTIKTPMKPGDDKLAVKSRDDLENSKFTNNSNPSAIYSTPKPQNKKIGLSKLQGNTKDPLIILKESEKETLKPRRTNQTSTKLEFLNSGQSKKNSASPELVKSRTSIQKIRKKSEYLSLIDRHQTSRSLIRKNRSNSTKRYSKNIFNQKIPNASFFNNQSSLVQKSTMNSILDDMPDNVTDQEVIITIGKNDFRDNGALCITLLSSLEDSFLEIKKNSFITNYKDILSQTAKDNPQVDIISNTFEIDEKSTDKTVKFERACTNLKFEDNEFVRLRGADSRPNVWLRLMGCADEDQLQSLDIEPEVFVSPRRSSGRPESKAENEVKLGGAKRAEGEEAMFRVKSGGVVLGNQDGGLKERRMKYKPRKLSNVLGKRLGSGLIDYKIFGDQRG